MKKIFNIFALLLLIGVVNAQQLDRSIRPLPGPAKEIDIKDAKTVILSNGLKVFIVEDNRAPIVFYSLSLDVKPALEGDKAGMQELFGDVFGKATTSRTKEQINKDADLIGSRLNVYARGGSIRVLKKYESKALDLFADVLFNPAFNENELNMSRDKYKSALTANKDDAGQINIRLSSILTYGNKYPDGEAESAASLDNVKISDLQNFYSTYFAPNVARLVIVGNITESEAKANAEKYFGSWKKKTVPVATYTIPKLPAATTVAMVEKPGAVQSMIDISYPIEYKFGTADEMAASVMNHILGGGMSSHIVQNLREKHSYTYGVYSSLQKGELIGRFNISSGRGAASVKAVATDSAIYQVLYEMRDLIKTPISAKELEDAKAFLAGSFARSLENPSTVAQFAINIDKYHLPKDYYKNYLKRLEAVSIADIQAAAKKYIKPDNAIIVVVGDKSYAEGLKAFAADKTVHFYDADGNPVAAPAPAQPATVSAEDVIKKYVQALGGEAAINKINDYKIAGEISAMGQTMEMTQLFKKPQWSLTEINMNGMSIQKITFNGTHLKLSGMQGNQDFTEGDMFDMVKMNLGICPDAGYIKNGYTVEIKGIEKVKGKEAYALSIKKGSISIVNYFDKESGLKVKTQSTAKTPMGDMQQVQEYSDYRPVEGVLFPFSMKQIASGMEMLMTIKSIDVNKGVADSAFN